MQKFWEGFSSKKRESYNHFFSFVLFWSFILETYGFLRKKMIKEYPQTGKNSFSNLKDANKKQIYISY